MRQLLSKHGSESGFTIVEALVALTISSLLLAGLIQGISIATRQIFTSEFLASNLRDAKLAVIQGNSDQLSLAEKHRGLRHDIFVTHVEFSDGQIGDQNLVIHDVELPTRLGSIRLRALEIENQ